MFPSYAYYKDLETIANPISMSICSTQKMLSKYHFP
jgi:hypothetical protein